MKKILFSLLGVVVLGLLSAIPAGKNYQPRVAFTNSLETGLPTPILRLEMNEGSGVTMADSSGAGNTFTNFGATWITGKSGSGGALQFDGVNDFGRSVANIVFGVKTNTVCCWLWWDAFADNDDLLCELANSGTGNHDAAFFIDPNNGAPAGTFGCFIQDSVAGAAFRSETMTRPSAAAWHHYAFVLDGPANGGVLGDIKIYLDGTLQTLTLDQNTKDQASDFKTEILWLMSRGGTSLFGAGRLDDFGIWPGELSSAQITTIMDQAR